MSSQALTSYDADSRARAAADRLGLRVVELTDSAAHHAAAALLARVWGAASPDSVCGPALMTALVRAGNYVAGAYLGDRLVAAAVAFFGAGAARSGAPCQVDSLHSHVAGVDREVAIRGIGFALKQHQRAWALRRGIGRVCWTFDPLIARNAFFNLQKLGATATEYLPDFYGELDDSVNAGDPSDRLYVTWELDSPAAVSAATGELVALDPAVLAEATVLVDRVGPRPVARDLTGDGPLRLAVPEDVEALRRTDPALAARWRYVVREAMRGALAAGYRVDGITRDGVFLLDRPA